jgi:hypothetical protein
MMKRPSSPSSAPSKKHKKSPRVSETTITAPGEHNAQIVDSSWEKVKRRKQKKAEKREAKLDVCVVFDIAPRHKI